MHHHTDDISKSFYREIIYHDTDALLIYRPALDSALFSFNNSPPPHIIHKKSVYIDYTHLHLVSP